MYAQNCNCYICARPFPANLMAEVLDGKRICPQCGREIEELYFNDQDKFDDGILDDTPIIGNKTNAQRRQKKEGIIIENVAEDS